MADIHSIWLMPRGDDAALFEDLVARLAARFGTEPFIPHLTLVEDMPRSAEDLAVILEDGFAGEAGFGAAITEIVTGPSFFRSLHAAFRPAGRLLDLKRIAIERFGTGDVGSFMPHVSLAYGVPEAAGATAIAELSTLLGGRTVHFDAVVVAASAQSIPIRDWAIVHRHRLP